MTRRIERVLGFWGFGFLDRCYPRKNADERGFKIRKAGKGDIGKILILCKKLDEYHSKRDGKDISASLMKSKRNILEKDIASGKGVVFLLEYEGRFVGYIFVLASHPKEKKKGGNSIGYISDLYVDEEYRRRGFGARLIKEAEKWLKSKGSKNIVLNVEAWNVEALKMYEKLGFENKSVRMEKGL
jgi:ribosomal protein S18 acetylase RimI-like enzyme